MIYNQIRMTLFFCIQAVSEAAKLAGSSIKFTNVDGVLSCGISLEKDDPTWSANIKRALASLFTNYAYRQGQYPAQSYQEVNENQKMSVQNKCKRITIFMLFLARCVR